MHDKKGRFVPGDVERARAGGLARWENDARRRAELPALRAENAELHATLAALRAALIEHAGDERRIVGAVRDLLGPDRRPIAAASDEAALRAVYLLTLAEAGTPAARLLHVRALVQAALGDRLAGGSAGRTGG